MDFGRAFSYVFQDPDWVKKVLLAALISLIPIVGQLYLVGWGLAVAQRIIRGQQDLLPEIEFGEHLGRGFKAAIIGLVYALPAILFATPIWLFPIIGVSAEMSEETLSIVTLILSLCCGGLVLIYSILMALMVPAATGNFLASGRLGAAFNFGQVFGLVRAAPGPYLMVLLGSIIVGLIAPLGSIACAVGVFVTAAYGTLITSHLIGQAYRSAVSLRR
ncbi:MAG: DUF4013 domain-containing protein [Anaerolineaceae bacterium]|nr:DUF4013 domain-containing protein [Anaerolineaceae bacterium]